MSKNNAQRTFTVASRSSIELPVSDVMSNGQFELFSRVEDKALLFLQIRRGKLTITAGRYVGLIPLTPLISINVVPKLGVSNLTHVLELSRGSLITLNDVDRIYDTVATTGATVLSFLLQNLIDALTAVCDKGLLKDYVKTADVASDLRGGLNMSATIQTCWSKGQKHRANFDRYDQTTNVAPNRLIKFALEYALTVLAKSGGDLKLRKHANCIHHELPSEIQNYSSKDYAVCQSIVQKRSLPATRGYYYRALEVALLILSKRSVCMDHLGSEIALQTFLLDFEEVFERYLRRVLEMRTEKGVRVFDGNGDGKKSLYDNRSHPPAQPDIVLQHPAGTVLIAEVKYKEKPDRADINQAITYAVCYRTDKVVLIHQSRANGPFGLYPIGTINGISITGYGFNLDAHDLEKEEQAFASSLLSIAPATTQTLAA